MKEQRGADDTWTYYLSISVSFSGTNVLSYPQLLYTVQDTKGERATEKKAQKKASYLMDFFHNTSSDLCVLW